MKADCISIEKARYSNLFYFVANVIIYRESDGRCLLLKRSAKEKVHPGKYCVPGGKLEWTDLDIANPTKMNGDVYDFDNALESLLIRETLEECNISIQNKFIYIKSTAYVRPDGIPVMMLKFSAKFNTGEVRLEPGKFDGYAWANAEEVKMLDCIAGITEEINDTINTWKG